MIKFLEDKNRKFDCSAFQSKAFKGFTLIRTLLRKNLDKVQPRRGFTLIELLVVISIIAILTGFGTARYLTAERQSRDTRRKSDLNQYRIALENYASANNLVFPPVCGNVDNSLCSFAAFKTTYLAGECLQDPRPNTSYVYCSDSTGSRYAMWAKLETGSNDYFVVCSNNRSGKLSLEPSKRPDIPTQIPYILDGNCPL